MPSDILSLPSGSQKSYECRDSQSEPSPKKRKAPAVQASRAKIARVKPKEPRAEHNSFQEFLLLNNEELRRANDLAKGKCTRLCNSRNHWAKRARQLETEKAKRHKQLEISKLKELELKMLLEKARLENGKLKEVLEVKELEFQHIRAENWPSIRKVKSDNAELQRSLEAEKQHRRQDIEASSRREEELRKVNEGDVVDRHTYRSNETDPDYHKILAENKALIKQSKEDAKTVERQDQHLVNVENMYRDVADELRAEIRQLKEQRNTSVLEARHMRSGLGEVVAKANTFLGTRYEDMLSEAEMTLSRSRQAASLRLEEKEQIIQEKNEQNTGFRTSDLQRSNQESQTRRDEDSSNYTAQIEALQTRLEEREHIIQENERDTDLRISNLQKGIQESQARLDEKTKHTDFELETLRRKLADAEKLLENEKESKNTLQAQLDEFDIRESDRLWDLMP